MRWRLALRLQNLQRLADLLGGRSQLWLLLPQLGEQWLDAEVGIRQPQSADGLKEGIRRAGLAHAMAGATPVAVSPSCLRRRQNGTKAKHVMCMHICMCM